MVEPGYLHQQWLLSQAGFLALDKMGPGNGGGWGGWGAQEINLAFFILSEAAQSKYWRQKIITLSCQSMEYVFS